MSAAAVVSPKEIVVGDRIVVTPRLDDQFGLEVTDVVDDTTPTRVGVHVEGYRIAVHTPHARSSDTLVWRYLSDLVHIERVVS